MKRPGRLQSGERRLLVVRIAWLALYPLSLALLLVSFGPRFAELTAADAGAGSLLRPATGSYGLALFALEALILFQYACNTLLMAWRRSDDWVALYTSIGGPMLLMLVLPAPEALRLADPRWEGVVTAAQWLGAAMPGAWLFFFPDGRFVPRWATSLALIWPVIWAATAFMFPGGSGLFTMPPAALAVWSVWITGGLCAQVYRIVKVAGPVQRQQTKLLLASTWVLFIGSLFVLPARFLPLADLPPLLRPEVALPALLISVAGFGTGFWMAVLRYRLWDIDIVVRRTLVYGTLTAALVATYVSGVVLSQNLLRPFTSGSEVAVAGSTLLVVALAAPLRRRIQGAVDRRFYRSRYDAARTLDAFGARLRDEVDLDSVRADLLGVVGETLRPAHASVWLRPVARFAGSEPSSRDRVSELPHLAPRFRSDALDVARPHP